MASKIKSEPKKYKYTSTCTICRKKYLYDILESVPDKCCDYKLVINDNSRLLSRFKDELLQLKSF